MKLELERLKLLIEIIERAIFKIIDLLELPLYLLKIYLFINRSVKQFLDN